MDFLKLMALLLRIIFGLSVLLFISPVFSQSLPIGLSINSSGMSAQYALDFKNGIEAFITAENAKKRFGKYKLELLVMEDLGKPERIYANTKRLLKHKQVLTLLTAHPLEQLPKMVSMARDYDTLLLSAGSNIAFRSRDNLAFLSANLDDMLKPAQNLLERADDTYLISQTTTQESHWHSALAKRASSSIYQVSPDQLATIAIENNSLFILDLNFIAATPLVQNILATNDTATVLVLPKTGATGLAHALGQHLSPQQQNRLYYLHAVPLHNSQLPLIIRFYKDMADFNPHANLNHQALKGYILASLAAESIYHSVKGLQTDSVLDVVTLPFQVLDQVVGWVKHAGSDISSAEVVETFNRMKNYDGGLDQHITVSKDRVILNNSWLTQADENGNFREVAQAGRGIF